MDLRCVVVRSAALARQPVTAGHSWVKLKLELDGFKSIVANWHCPMRMRRQNCKKGSWCMHYPVQYGVRSMLTGVHHRSRNALRADQRQTYHILSDPFIYAWVVLV